MGVDHAEAATACITDGGRWHARNATLAQNGVVLGSSEIDLSRAS